MTGTSWFVPVAVAVVAAAGGLIVFEPRLLWGTVPLAAFATVLLVLRWLWGSTRERTDAQRPRRTGRRRRTVTSPAASDPGSVPPPPDLGAQSPRPTIPLAPTDRPPTSPGPVVPPLPVGPLPAALDPPTLEGGSSAGRALWRLPGRTAQPAAALDAARVGDLEVRAASVIGAGHRCAEPADCRQDAYALAQDGRRAHLVVAVADGLSDSAHSELGARVAVSTAVRELVRALDQLGGPGDIDARRLFNTVAGEMLGTGRGRGLADRDLCCLLVVAVIPTAAAPDGSRPVWSAQVGDVSVWTHGERLQQQTGSLKSGLDRNTVDAVLPYHPEQVTVTPLVVRPGSGVAVMSDGVGDLLTDVATAPDFFAERWAIPRHPAAFLLDLCVDAPGQDDDRTAVVVWCGPNLAPRAQELC